MYVWRKLASAEWIAMALERTRVPAERVVMIQTPAGRGKIRLEVYCASREEARLFVKDCGGSVSELADDRWQPGLDDATTADRPLRVGRSLLVTARQSNVERLRVAHLGRPVLCIPAGMAFGTGEHSTTAMCLRLLDGVAHCLPWQTDWELLDLGTGSGILALAGRILGASEALGLDNDAHAVRTARGNARLNRVPDVSFARADLLAWQPERQWAVVTANLFSELLIRLAPAICDAIKERGYLILSGILGTQAEEVAAAFRSRELEIVETKARGRWRALLGRKTR